MIIGNYDVAGFTEDETKKAFTFDQFKLSLEEEKVEKSKITNERQDTIKQVYDLYLHPAEVTKRKRENWKRYIAFLKENKLPHNQQNINVFKKTKQFIKTQEVRSVAVLLCHIPTKDIYYIISQMKDRIARSQSASSYLYSCTKQTKI